MNAKSFDDMSAVEIPLLEDIVSSPLPTPKDVADIATASWGLHAQVAIEHPHEMSPPIDAGFSETPVHATPATESATLADADPNSETLILAEKAELASARRVLDGQLERILDETVRETIQKITPEIQELLVTTLYPVLEAELRRAFKHAAAQTNPIPEAPI